MSSFVRTVLTLSKDVRVVLYDKFPHGLGRTKWLDDTLRKAMKEEGRLE